VISRSSNLARSARLATVFSEGTVRVSFLLALTSASAGGGWSVQVACGLAVFPVLSPEVNDLLGVQGVLLH
jgi:hypothetical protein